MKKIIRIARVELSNLFYSPIAWLLLIIFLVQCSITFTDTIRNFLVVQKMTKLFSSPPRSVTFALLATRSGFFATIVSKLYLYIPLLTMGLMSREVSSGSIRLLYSSPVKTSQIVLGKFVAMMVYNLLLLLVLVIFAVACVWAIPHADKGIILSGLFGCLLLLSTYAAIGLFMSCLTSYQVVAALSTLAVFAALQYIGGVWQGVDFVRDLTYVLSLGTRTQDIFGGLITSRDVLYFVIITTLFLCFSTLRLRSDQQYFPLAVKVVRYTGLLVAALAIGYITSRPMMTAYLDATALRVNTITPATQELLHATGDEPLEITVYVNLLDTRYMLGAPNVRNTFLRTWERYTRFKAIQFRFCYYYDTTAGSSRMFDKVYKGQTLQQVAKDHAKTNNVSFDRFKQPGKMRRVPGLADEGGRMVLQLSYKGRSTFLRMYDDPETWPSEAQFSGALKRLMLPQSAQRVAFLSGHLERSVNKSGDRDYSLFSTTKSMRNSLINNGFDVLTIEDGQEIPANLAVLVIADPKVAFSNLMLEKLREYINNGGNLILTTEPGKHVVAAPLLNLVGVKMSEGVLVAANKDQAPDIIQPNLAPAAGNLSQQAAGMYSRRQTLFIPGVTALDHTNDSAAFEAQPLLTTTGKGAWLRKGQVVNDSAMVAFNEKEGDVAGDFVTAYALRRKWSGREQRVVVTGDADFMSNQTLLLHQGNVGFCTALFKWCSGGLFPIELSRKEIRDTGIELTDEKADAMKLVLLWILPGLLILAGTILLIRRKRK